jgi:hypothetical protein
VQAVIHGSGVALLTENYRRPFGNWTWTQGEKTVHTSLEIYINNVKDYSINSVYI